MTTLYWHDYETWGATPSIDRPSQFAGVRTDIDLNIIGEPLVEYCRPPVDILPQIEACLVTGISPQTARDQGLPESEFIEKVHAELSVPGTCGVGYNSIRFDDEITRYTLYRNFFDPYEREWKNGNSRWDIIDMVRTVFALRPDGIEWPMVDGVPSFRLELLTEANAIAHGSAHDAYSDVEATIDFARLIKTRKPELYNFIFQNRAKQSVMRMIDIKRRKPLLHISSKFPASRGCAGLVVPLAEHPVNKNAVIVYELSVDPSELESLSAEEIMQRVFVSNDDLPEGKQRLPIKLIHMNKCPILLPAKMLDDKTAKRLHIDRDICERHWQAILKMELEYKLRQMYKLQSFEASLDAERQLYDGFIGDSDKHLMSSLRDRDIDALTDSVFLFDDERLNQMLIGFKARNYPHILSQAEHLQWREHVKHRLLYGEDGIQSLAQFRENLFRIKSMQSDDPNVITLLNDLTNYANELEAEWCVS
jgi:exodeoxyribonuclease-1